MFIWLRSTIVALLHSSTVITIPYPYPYPSLCCILTAGKDSSLLILRSRTAQRACFSLRIFLVLPPIQLRWSGWPKAASPGGLSGEYMKHIHQNFGPGGPCLPIVLLISMWSKWSISSGWLVKYQFLLDFSSDTCIWRETILSWRFSTNPTKFSVDKATHIFGCVRKL